MCAHRWRTRVKPKVLVSNRWGRNCGFRVVTFTVVASLHHDINTMSLGSSGVLTGSVSSCFSSRSSLDTSGGSHFGSGASSLSQSGACGSSHLEKRNVQRGSFEDYLRRGLIVFETLFKVLDRDKCGEIPYPQLKGQLEFRGLRDGAKLNELWRTIIDKDKNNRASIGEFLVVMYMWGSRKLGSYRVLFRQNLKEASAAKMCMEYLERAYQQYASGGTLDRPQAEKFFAEKLPGVSLRCLCHFFPTKTTISFSGFLKLAYVAMGGPVEGLMEGPVSVPPVGKAPETTKFWQETLATYKVLEEDFGTVGQGSHIKLEDLLGQQTHALEKYHAMVGRYCDVCHAEAVYRHVLLLCLASAS